MHKAALCLVLPMLLVAGATLGQPIRPPTLDLDTRGR